MSTVSTSRIPVERRYSVGTLTFGTQVYSLVSQSFYDSLPIWTLEIVRDPEEGELRTRSSMYSFNLGLEPVYLFIPHICTCVYICLCISVGVSL